MHLLLHIIEAFASHSGSAGPWWGLALKKSLGQACGAAVFLCAVMGRPQTRNGHRAVA